MVLADPPYVRADAQFKHLKGDEDTQQTAVTAWKQFRASLLKSNIYQTLYEKWDLYIPFLERAFQLLSYKGQMIFIIPDAYNAAKYSVRSHQFFLHNTRVERIDFCTDIPLFTANVNNTILHFANEKPTSTDEPLRVRRWGRQPDDFTAHADVLPTASQMELGASLFRVNGLESAQETKAFVSLDKVCYVSWGLRPNSDDRHYRGLFKAEDVVSDKQNRLHPKPYIESKGTTKWWPCYIRYLEWGTTRAPAMFARPTFPELYDVPEKLLATDVSGAAPRVAYDDQRLIHNHSMCSIVPWHYLKGVVNASINKTSKYEYQDGQGDRSERENISQQFSTKYLLAVVNSAFARNWLALKRRNRIHVYPDDWKPLPVAKISIGDQTEIVRLVDAILAEFRVHGCPLPPNASAEVSKLEREIDARVARLCGLTEADVTAIERVEGGVTTLS